MAMNYESLAAAKTEAGSIRRWMNWSELDVDAIIEDAQSLIFQTLRVREMRTLFDDILVEAGQSSVALPQYFLDPIGLKDVTNNIDMQLVDEARLLQERIYDENGALVESSAAYLYAIFGESLQFEYKYDTAATMKLVGYKTPTFVSSTNQTNFVVNRYPHLMRTACMAVASDMMNNREREQVYMTKLVAYIQDINAKDEMSYRGVTLNIELR